MNTFLMPILFSGWTCSLKEKHNSKVSTKSTVSCLTSFYWNSLTMTVDEYLWQCSYVGNNCNVSISFKTVITHVWKWIQLECLTSCLWCKHISNLTLMVLPISLQRQLINLPDNVPLKEFVSWHDHLGYGLQHFACILLVFINW